MESNPEIEMAVGAFVAGLSLSALVFFKFAAALQIKRALWRN